MIKIDKSEEILRFKQILLKDHMEDVKKEADLMFQQYMQQQASQKEEENQAMTGGNNFV